MELHNQADTLIYSTEKTLKDSEDKVSDSLKNDINEKISQLKKATEDNNIEGMKDGIEKLTESSHKLAEEIYKQSQPEQEQQAYSDTSSSEQETGSTQDTQQDEKIFDAEYKEEDGDNSK